MSVNVHVYDVLFDAKFNAYYITLLFVNEKCVCVCAFANVYLPHTNTQTSPFYNLGKCRRDETFFLGVSFSLSVDDNSYFSLGNKKTETSCDSDVWSERSVFSRNNFERARALVFSVTALVPTLAT